MRLNKVLSFVFVVALFVVSFPAYAQNEQMNDRKFVHNLDVMWPGQQDGKFKVSLVGYHFYPWCFGRLCGPGVGVLWSVKPNVENGSSLEIAMPFGARMNSRDNDSKFDFYLNVAPTVGKGGLGVGVGLSLSPRPKS